MQTPSSFQMSSPFMRLPLELREHIYEYALADPNSQRRVRLSHGENDRHHAEWSDEFRPALALFLVSKGVYQEASAVFYTNITFELECSYQRSRCEPTLKFFQNRPPGALAKIRKVRLHFHPSKRSFPGDGQQHSIYWPEIARWLQNRDIRDLFVRLPDYGHHEFFQQDELPTESRLSFIRFLAELPHLRHLQIYGEADILNGGGMPAICDRFRKYLIAVRNIVYRVDYEDSARADHGVCISYDHGEPESFMAPSVSGKIDIDYTGKTSTHMAWRAKVFPNRWCIECGTFKAYGFNWCLGHEDFKISSPHDVWDSKLWGDKPFEEYLPIGTTREDFDQAQEYLRAGRPLDTWGFYPKCGRL